MREVKNILFTENIDLSLLKRIPLRFAKTNHILPLRQENSKLITAVAGDQGVLALLELAKTLSLTPEPIKVAETELMEAINKCYGQLGSAEEVMSHISGEDFSAIATEFESPRDILELTEEAPIIRLLNALLLQAVKERASDIHIEPYEKELVVRMRIDGILHRVLTPPKIVQEALISRIKIMANLDIAEKRLPQDGRLRILIAGRDIDIRVSIVPTSFGERVVLRLLDRKQGVLGLWEIGLEKEDEKMLEELLLRPNGIILVTGPTGSGKTTTLYAALNRVHSESKNIITIEDPVEYQLKGVGQIQVNPKIGLSFASGLRSILRQDPDVIMVGEIRDRETAEIAIQASLTGHLVLSTLHTNDASSAITRLIEMGIEPFLVASSLIGIIAQRLVRVICPYCKEEYFPSEAEKAYFTNSEPRCLYRGKGCEKCKHTSYLGRTGVFEILVVDKDLRTMITERSDSQSIKQQAIIKGMKTLRMDGLNKVLKGITTLEEVLRVTPKDVEISL
ncbi:MAG: type II secretion system ATPase GspE [Candidatus Desulfofervidaceae bacterium]|nr:type II secretion system ATPase GspE [Candidatus Desulfofervidaceae bacterium]